MQINLSFWRRSINSDVARNMDYRIVIDQLAGSLGFLSTLTGFGFFAACKVQAVVYDSARL